MTSLRLPSRLALVALALSAGLAGTSCSKSGPAASTGGAVTPAGKKIVIGLSLDTLQEERWQHDRDIFVAAAEKLGATVVVQAANSNNTVQVQDIKTLITRGVDVLVVVPFDGNGLSTAVKDANDAKIPLIAYDRLILGTNIDYYLTFDNVKVGEEQAKYLVAHLPEGRKAKIVRIYGYKGDHNATLFKEGQDHILDPLIKSGKIEVVHEDWADGWKPAEAVKIMNAAITKAGRDIDAVLASNDGTAGGAITALEQEKLAGKVLVTGQDAELAACQRIMQGTQAMTIYKPLKTLATHAAEVAVAVAQGKPPVVTATIDNGFKKVPFIFENVITVDKANMMATVVADGFQKAADLK